MLKRNLWCSVIGAGILAPSYSECADSLRTIDSVLDRISNSEIVRKAPSPAEDTKSAAGKESLPSKVVHGVWAQDYDGSAFFSRFKIAAGGGFNSNVKEIGNGAPLAAKVAREGATFMETRGDMSLQRFFPKTGGELLSVLRFDYSIVEDIYGRLSSSNTTFQSGALAYQYPVTERLGLQVALKDTWIRVDDANLENLSTFNVGMRVQMTEQLQFSTGYNIGWRESGGQGTRSTDRDSLYNSTEATLSWKPSPRFAMSVTHAFQYFAARGDEAEIRRQEIEGAFRYTVLPKNEGRPLQELTLEGKWKYRFDDYAQRSAAVNGKYAREDNRNIAAIILTAALNTRWAIITDFQFTDNNSNINGRSFDQTTIRSRVQYAF